MYNPDSQGREVGKNFLLFVIKACRHFSSTDHVAQYILNAHPIEEILRRDKAQMKIRSHFPVWLTFLLQSTLSCHDMPEH